MVTKSTSINFYDLFESLKEALLRLNPFDLYKNSVIFYTYLGAITSLIYFFIDAYKDKPSWLYFHIAFWLWFTVFITNFAECLAELKGRRQLEILKLNKNQGLVRLIVGDQNKEVNQEVLKKGDKILCQMGDFIPFDGKVIDGIATVDESLVTEIQVLIKISLLQVLGL
jgi:K+-transporting ATPase ATPase B chain